MLTQLSNLVFIGDDHERRSNSLKDNSWVSFPGLDMGEVRLSRRPRRGPVCRILSHCRYPLHTSFLEGINNKIKVIMRMAYGFRDDAYFFLKIRAAIPGIP